MPLWGSARVGFVGRREPLGSIGYKSCQDCMTSQVWTPPFGMQAPFWVLVMKAGSKIGGNPFSPASLRRGARCTHTGEQTHTRISTCGMGYSGDNRVVEEGMSEDGGG